MKRTDHRVRASSGRDRAFTLCASVVLMPALLCSASIDARAADPGSQTLRIAVSEPETLNPLLQRQDDAWFIDSLVFDSLVQNRATGPAPQLAETVPTLANGGISADGRTIVYKLRRGVRWHDGTPLTSRDVAFSQQAMLNPKNNVPVRRPYTNVDHLETPDPYTFIVHLSKPYAPFVAEWFGGSGVILPEHLLAKYAELNDVAFNSAPVGSGAFIFDHWDRGREIVFRANDAYFLGRPKIQRIVVKLIPDQNSANIGLQTGEIDWSLHAGSGSARRFSGSQQVVTRLFPLNGVTALVFQTRRPPLDDKRVRQAIALALDRVSIVNKVSGEFATPATGYDGPGSWAYDPTLHALAFDPARSRALFAQAGWLPGPGGLLTRDGKPLSLTLVYATGAAAYPLMIQAMLKTVGVDVALKPQAPNVLFAPLAEHGTIESGTYDMFIAAYVNSSSDPDPTALLACESIPPNGFNVARWCNAQVDRLIADALVHADIPTRKRDYRLASQIVLDEVPAVILAWPRDVELMRRGVHIDNGSPDIEPPYLWSKDASP